MALHRDPKVRKQIVDFLKKYCWKNENGETECDLTGLMTLLLAMESEVQRAKDEQEVVKKLLVEDEDVRLQRIVEQKVPGRNYVVIRRPKPDQACPLRCQERQKKPKKPPDVMTFVSHYNAPIMPPEYGFVDQFQEDSAEDHDRNFNWLSDIVKDRSYDVDKAVRRMEKKITKKVKLRF